MTSSHPHTAGRTESPRADKAVILAVWKHGESDAMDLALRFHISESEAYAIIAHRNDRPAKEPRVAKVPFAGLRTAGAPSRRRPSPVNAACLYRLTDGQEYLHESGLSTTEDKRFAWKGTADKALACIARFPAAASMNMQVVM